MEISLFLIQILMKHLLKKNASSLAVQLLLHVKNCVIISLREFRRESKEISIKFEFLWKDHQWSKPQCSVQETTCDPNIVHILFLETDRDRLHGETCWKKWIARNSCAWHDSSCHVMYKMLKKNHCIRIWMKPNKISIKCGLHWWEQNGLQ